MEGGQPLKTRAAMFATACAAASLAAFIVVGCNGDGSGDAVDEGHIWEGHDFGDNDPNLYVAMGDSITAGDEDVSAESYPDKLETMLGKQVRNRGVQGATSEDGARLVVDTVSDFKPGYLLILYGANDIIRSEPVENAIANVRYMVHVARNNKTIPVVATLTPAYGRHAGMMGNIGRFNTLLREFAATENVALADLYEAFPASSVYFGEDGLHPNDLGTAVIASTFYDVLK